MDVRAQEEGAVKKSIEVFCCYARKDQLLLLDLKAHLTPLVREGLITLWSDVDIDAGMEWEKEIYRHLNTARIILLLVSPDFMASDYCYSVEMQRAIERHERGETCVIPTILRPVSWQNTPFGKFQALPTDANPITSKKWHDRDEAFYEVVKGIRAAVEAQLAEDERHRKAEEAEQTRKKEEERARQAEEERVRLERTRLVEKERARQEEERTRLAKTNDKTYQQAMEEIKTRHSEEPIRQAAVGPKTSLMRSRIGAVIAIGIVLLNWWGVLAILGIIHYSLWLILGVIVLLSLSCFLVPMPSIIRLIYSMLSLPVIIGWGIAGWILGPSVSLRIPIPSIYLSLGLAVIGPLLSFVEMGLLTLWFYRRSYRR